MPGWWEAWVHGRWCGHRHEDPSVARACGRIVENRNRMGWGVSGYAKRHGARSER